MRAARIGVLIVLSAGASNAKLVPGDARRGVELFRTQKCITCHSIRGEGGTSAPDLGIILGRGYTPSWMAATMWNHAPVMWAALEKQGIQKPRLTEGQAADLFAHFHSVRYFDGPGDAGRGKQVFTSKHCAACHGITDPLPDGGPAVASWRSLCAPLLFAQEMWNHASQMEVRMASRKIDWPKLSGQELIDLLVYLQNLPPARGRVGEFVLPSGVEGETLFQTKGCANCHLGKLALGDRPAQGTLTDFAASMWNHVPDMRRYGRKTGQAPPVLEGDEMPQIITYLWYVRIFAERGSAGRGRRVFTRKNCAACHDEPSSGAPDLRKMLAARSEPLRPFSMVSVLWLHGPAMLARMKATNLSWPSFSRGEMVDLMAYLNSTEFRGHADQIRDGPSQNRTTGHN